MWNEVENHSAQGWREKEVLICCLLSPLASRTWIYLHVCIARFVQVAHYWKQDVSVRDPQRGAELHLWETGWSLWGLVITALAGEGNGVERIWVIRKRNWPNEIPRPHQSKDWRDPRTCIHLRVWRKDRRGGEETNEKASRGKRKIIVIIIVTAITMIAVVIIVIAASIL